MKITLDTTKGIFIVPNSFYTEIEKQNKILEKAGVDKRVSAREIIEEAIEEAFKRPILTQKQLKDWNPDLENQMADNK